ncbi:MAG: hypothetical protein JSS66_08080 [Armatimonadetes bacterium]|nr:hypothetical protein [Armatimonadota bacterium]
MKRSHHRSGVLLLIALASSVASASGVYLDTFLSHYKIKDGSALAEKSCGICHVSDSDFKFNPFGKDVKKAMTDRNAEEVDAALLVSIENLDSDGDGTPNGKEIAAGTAPGDPSSGGAPGTKPAAAATEEAKKPAPFPPKNGFHPAIVHFPIALFIGGLVLDFLGMLRKDKTLLQAGWYCILMAAVTSLGGIASGVLAMGLQKLPYRGLIFTHLTMAVASSVIIWIMVAMRVHRHEKMNVPMRFLYYVLAAATFVLISWAGHLGGVFVYGE